jgi:hypothetical protein
MDLGEFFKKLTSGDIPAGTLGGGGIVVLILGAMLARRGMKIIFFLAGLGLLAGAVWWHFHYRH